MDSTGIQADHAADEPLWSEAGWAFQTYVLRRQASHGGLPRRVLADFLIGAHASLHADALMTLDSQHYRLAFPDLKLVVPA